MDLQKSIEIFQSEGLKTAAEVVLHRLGQMGTTGELILERYAFGPEGRIQDPRLLTDVAGVHFENPVLFGAGWDKKGRAAKGLYDLGFAGGEVGTVLPYRQYGNPKPRMWTKGENHSVSLNRLGFNSPGDDVVEAYLNEVWPLSFPVGINVGRNNRMTNDEAVRAHELVIKRLHKKASFITLGISSPNTKDVRALQNKGPFRDVLQGAKAAMEEAGHVVPLFAKIDAERTDHELYDMIELALDEKIAGFVATNTYMGDKLKERYGWAGQNGGLSGDDPEYRRITTNVVRFIRQHGGKDLTIMGAGGVSTWGDAVEKMKAGASAVQVVTAMRPSRGKVAANIVRGLRDYVNREGIKNIQDIVGADVD